MNYKDRALRKGDAILIPSALFGLDPDQFADPMTVDFDRPDAARHAAFGSGPHRCPGSNLARLELRLLLEEWLSRIPDFEVDPSGEVIAYPGTSTGLSHLPLMWNPA
jgi:cytochrome P450